MSTRRQCPGRSGAAAGQGLLLPGPLADEGQHGDLVVAASQGRRPWGAAAPDRERSRPRWPPIATPPSRPGELPPRRNGRRPGGSSRCSCRKAGPRPGGGSRARLSCMLKDHTHIHIAPDMRALSSKFRARADLNYIDEYVLIDSGTKALADRQLLPSLLREGTGCRRRTILSGLQNTSDIQNPSDASFRTRPSLLRPTKSPTHAASWLPGDDYYTNFHEGDPFIKVPEGYARLPGAGYEALHPELEGCRSRRLSRHPQDGHPGRCGSLLTGVHQVSPSCRT